MRFMCGFKAGWGERSLEQLNPAKPSAGLSIINYQKSQWEDIQIYESERKMFKDTEECQGGNEQSKKK